MTGLLLQVCSFAAIALLLTSCHYSDEQKWSVCCALYINSDETSSSPARATIIAWQGRTWFGGDGSTTEVLASGKSRETWKNEQVATAIADFLASNAGRRATDYLADLGMTCRTEAITQKNGATHCEIELPIQARCGPTYRWLPGTTPIPNQLQKPISATLAMTVDLSGNTLTGTQTRINPLPGGHLCHR